MDDSERVEVLKSSGDLQQLVESVRECVARGVDMNPYQIRPRGIGVGREILQDIPVVRPIVNEGESERRRVDAMKRQDILVNQPPPRRYQLPKDLLCFLEIPRRVDAEGFKGNILVVPSPSPDVGGSSRCDGNPSAFYEPSKRPDRIGNP